MVRRWDWTQHHPLGPAQKKIIADIQGGWELVSVPKARSKHRMWLMHYGGVGFNGPVKMVNTPAAEGLVTRNIVKIRCKERELFRYMLIPGAKERPCRKIPHKPKERKEDGNAHS